VAETENQRRGWGGRRPGAGRPRKQGAHAKPVRKAEKVLAAALPEVAQAQVQLAVGVWREETLPDGTRRVYQVPPSERACKDILDRIGGRPVARVEQEVNGPEGAPASQMVFYLPHNGREDPPDVEGWRGGEAERRSDGVME
jgi:hypothetical protein